MEDLTVPLKIQHLVTVDLQQEGSSRLLAVLDGSVCSVQWCPPLEDS